MNAGTRERMAGWLPPLALFVVVLAVWEGASILLGIKSFLLKAIDPFLKKNRRGGARIPVSVSGTYQKPSYHADPI